MNDEQMVEEILAATGGNILDEDEKSFAQRIVIAKHLVSTILMQGIAARSSYPACDDAEQAAFAHRTSE